jgi:hypothetical protein
MALFITMSHWLIISTPDQIGMRKSGGLGAKNLIAKSLVRAQKQALTYL